MGHETPRIGDGPSPVDIKGAMPVGEGSNARVWEVWDNNLEREGVLKLGFDEDLGHTLIEEHDRLSALRHSGVVKSLALYMLLDDQGDDIGPGLVLERLQGPGLEQLIAKRTTPTQGDLRSIVSNLVSALAHSHAHGVIHGDLRPDNVMLRHSDDLTSVTLIDFGPTQELIDPGRGINARYWSPERLTKSVPGPSALDDVYALGLIIAHWCNLTNVVPKTLEDQLVWYDTLASDVACRVPVPQDEDLGDIITRMLTLDPGARPSAKHLLARLENSASDDPLQAETSKASSTSTRVTIVGWLVATLLAFSWVATEALRKEPQTSAEPHSALATPKKTTRVIETPLAGALKSSQHALNQARRTAAAVSEFAYRRSKPAARARKRRVGPAKEKPLAKTTSKKVAATEPRNTPKEPKRVKKCVPNTSGPPTCYMVLEDKP